MHIQIHTKKCTKSNCNKLIKRIACMYRGYLRFLGLKITSITAHLTLLRHAFFMQILQSCSSNISYFEYTPPISIIKRQSYSIMLCGWSIVRSPQRNGLVFPLFHSGRKVKLCWINFAEPLCYK